MDAKRNPLSNLLYHKYYIDELYDNIIVRPVMTTLRNCFMNMLKSVSSKDCQRGWEARCMDGQYRQVCPDRQCRVLSFHDDLWNFTDPFIQRTDIDADRIPDLIAIFLSALLLFTVKREKFARQDCTYRCTGRIRSRLVAWFQYTTGCHCLLLMIPAGFP